MKQTLTIYPWDTRKGKLAIYRKVMKRLYKNDEERQKCLDYKYGYDMVTDVMKKNNLGVIPPGGKVVFLREGDYFRGEVPEGLMTAKADIAMDPSTPQRLTYYAGSSLIITLPPADESDPDGAKVLDYACSYIIWDQKSSEQSSPKKGNRSSKS